MEHSGFSILKIYASTTDKIESRLLYEHIVHRAKEEGISGITVNRGIMGYGLSSAIVTSRFWELTDKLPLTIEIIDETKKLEKFYGSLQKELLKMPKGCLVAMFPVNVLLHKEGNK